MLLQLNMRCLHLPLLGPEISRHKYSIILWGPCLTTPAIILMPWRADAPADPASDRAILNEFKAGCQNWNNVSQTLNYSGNAQPAAQQQACKSPAPTVSPGYMLLPWTPNTSHKTQLAAAAA